jgi:hypothetical protein
VSRNYQSVGMAGELPFAPDTRFGVRVLKRIY